MTEEELREIEQYVSRLNDDAYEGGSVYLGYLSRLIADVRTLQKHIDGNECGFDRTASHCENTYVCRCGYRGHA